MLSASYRLSEQSIIKLSSNVFKRFEHNIGSGKLFLYDFVDDKAWVGNSSANDLLNKIDGKKSLKNVYEELFRDFEDYDYLKLKESFDAIILNLLENRFLVIVNE